MKEYLNEDKIYVSIWKDNNTEFLLSNARILDTDMFVDTREFMWVEDEI